VLISWNLRRGSEGICDKTGTPSLSFEPDTFPNTSQQHHCSNLAGPPFVDDIPQCLYKGKEGQATTNIGLSLHVLYKKSSLCYYAFESFL
jgi:hypothetical protein